MGAPWRCLWSAVVNVEGMGSTLCVSGCCCWSSCVGTSEVMVAFCCGRLLVLLAGRGPGAVSSYFIGCIPEEPDKMLQWWQ